ncbi:exonuclease/endonuclease/phosphatase family protein [Aureliella helgolandensis]|uniref:Endonuclease/Exonuclease/phosphatase family protein n=1 Tax=Aureliella helgolandensis TaxID=2527968 RepID=A0A518G4I8_9BACT|nr:hypothetical protein [Aureliella helgolandensis]QDV23470.1 hypothetical protein Q31a_17690 [Aureliella helgolandensis]
MFPIKRRWPILTGIVAALTYAFNHYEIAGLEQLKFVARSQNSPLQLSQSSPAPLDIYGNPTYPSAANRPFDPTQYGVQTVPSAAAMGSPSASFSSNAQNQPWQGLLNAGEKFTLLAEQMQANSREQQQVGGAAGNLAISTPLAVSPSFVNVQPHRSGLPPAPPNGSLPSTAFNPNLGSTNPPPASVPVGTAASADSSASSNASGSFQASAGTARRSIRVASFNLESLGPAKLAKPHVMQTLISILRQYDIVALQGVQSPRDDILPMVVERLNQSGGNFDYLIGPRVGRVAPHDQYAFIFDTASVETDRYRLYTVEDPDDLINFDPLVAWFRCKGEAVERAFTFSVVNVRIDPDFSSAEQAILPGLIQAIQVDGRNEDDWIMTGDFCGGMAALRLLDDGNIRFAIRDIPTEVTGSQMLDSIFFPALATLEFTGRAGAFDFLRKYNLSIEQASEISRHMPVWAEFSIREGAEPGRIAPPLNANQVY